MNAVLKFAVVAGLFGLLNSAPALAAPKWASDFCQLLLTSAGPPPIKQAAPGQKKVLIISSGYGMGHNSTSTAIESAILAKDPNVLISTFEVEMLQHSALTRFEKWFFWTVVKKAPAVFDYFYKRHSKKAMRGGLEAVREHIDQRYLEERIALEKPDVIIAPHQLTAATLALMRKQGQLKNIKIGFVSTDYFVEFLPEVSRHLDATWVAQPQLKDSFIAAGAPAERVGVSGMPVNQEAFKPLDRAEFLASRNLDASVTTITLASGGEGVGNYPKIVKSLARSFSGQKLQIIAICGKNEAHFKNLTKMKDSLRRQGVELVVLGFTKQAEMFSFIKSSDLYITKSGGLSPAEGFAMNKPMILMDVYGGHERVNATFFGELNVAVINRNQNTIGDQAAAILRNPVLKNQMTVAQKKFTDSLDFSGIASFATP